MAAASPFIRVALQRVNICDGRLTKSSFCGCKLTIILRVTSSTEAQLAMTSHLETTVWWLRVGCQFDRMIGHHIYYNLGDRKQS